MTLRLRRQALAAALLVTAEPLAAQEAEPPPFAPHRFNEDWRGVDSGRAGADFWDPLKNIRLADDVALTLGGQLRERYEYVRNPDFRLQEAPKDDDYFLHRLLLHGDVRVNDTFRAFVEFGNFLSAGRSADPPPTDEAPLNLQQGFADLSVATGERGRGTVRGGRQEVSFGSSRLVSVRESPNIRRVFDGGRAFWQEEETRVDGFFLRPVQPDKSFFANEYDDRIRFWGVYGTTPVAALPGLGVDLYYLGYERPDGAFAQGTENERRHTVGTRLFGDAAGWDWDLELAYQFGSFGQGDIAAWTAALDGGYTADGWPMTPRLGLKANIASGDDDLDDDTLGTFNALFPKIPYFTEASLIAPANIMDVFSSLTLTLLADVAVTVGWNALWRQSSDDAFYAPPLDAIDGTEGGSRWVGHQTMLQVEWQATRNIDVNLAYVHFTAGSTIEKAGGRDVDYVAVWTSYRF